MDVRSQHWTDVSTGGRRRRRVIRNWTNYRTPHRDFSAATPLIESAARIPDDWDGNFDFERTSQAGALQTFFGNTRDLDNPAMVGFRLSDRPAFWCNLRPMGTLPNPVVINGPVRHAWRGLWKNTTLRYTDGAHKLTKEIVLRGPGHPTVFRFSVKIGPGLSLVFRDGSAAIRGPLGTERIHFPAPWGHDANGKFVRATMREGLVTPLGLRTIVIEVNEDDLASAVYPVTIDPTATISGTTDIEDTRLYAISPSNNYGGSGELHVRRHPSFPDGIDHGLVRIAAGAIPGGSISAFKMFMDVTNAGFASPLIQAYMVTDTNDWVEGTAPGLVQAGSASWNYRKDPTGWAGSAGCSTSGVDYDADATPPTLLIPIGVTGPYQFNLDPVWPPLWRDGARISNGMFFRSDPPDSPQTLTVFRSTEAVSGTPLYFEIDYDAGGAPVAAMMLPRRIA